MDQDRVILGQYSILKEEVVLGIFVVNIRPNEDIEMLPVMRGDCFSPLRVDFSTV